MNFIQLVRQGLAQLIKRLARQQAGQFSTGKAAPTHKIISRLLLSALMGLLLLSCASRSESVRLLELPDLPSVSEERQLSGSISEVAPPAVFSDLNELIADTRPKVTIAEPRPDQTINTTNLAPRINLRGLSIYKDEKLAAGPHLQVSLDNQPAQSLYSLDEAIEFSELAPGSHTLRVVAVKPWGESFKNEEAYAQTTFHVFAKTYENTPDIDQPQLTYIAPQGTYGAQPILLDFYLSNAPLHLLAASNPEIADWRIRCDINGQSFIFNQWQPMYLKGLKPGQNWVRLMLIDEQGSPIQNAFNSTVRVVDFDPNQRGTLAKMTRGELTVRDVGQIVVPNYEPPIEIIAPPEPDVPDQLNVPDLLESKEGAELEKPAESEEPATALDESKELLERETLEDELLEEELLEDAMIEDGLLEEEPLEEGLGSKTESDDGPQAITEDVSLELESEGTDETLEEAIAPIESLSEPEETETIQLTIQLLEEAASDDPVEAVTQVDAVAIEKDADKEDAGEKPGFFTRIKAFWQELEESQPIPVAEPEIETIENEDILEDFIEAPATSDQATSNQLLTDSPLLIPELQPSDLN